MGSVSSKLKLGSVRGLYKFEGKLQGTICLPVSQLWVSSTCRVCRCSSAVLVLLPANCGACASAFMSSKRCPCLIYEFGPVDKIQSWLDRMRRIIGGVTCCYNRTTATMYNNQPNGCCTLCWPITRSRESFAKACKGMPHGHTEL